MHAASVHPEPGSNSLMFCIYIFVSEAYISFPSERSVALYLLEFLFILKKKNFGVSSLCVHISFRDMSCLVVQFSMSRCLSPFGLPLSRTAHLVYHFFPSLSIPFFIFFQFVTKILILREFSALFFLY